MVTPSNRELRSNRDSSMFVDTIQLVQAPQRIGTGRACRSIVWLNRFDIGDGFLGETLNLPVELVPSFRIEGLGENREFTGIRISAGSVVDQRPDGVIERSSQTLENISKDQENRHMGLLKFNSISNLIHFRFFLDGD
jgi:hypothetical protein